MLMTKTNLEVVMIDKTVKSEKTDGGSLKIFKKIYVLSSATETTAHNWMTQNEWAYHANDLDVFQKIIICSSAWKYSMNRKMNVTPPAPW